MSVACPKCGCVESQVLASRQSADGLRIRRRRLCKGGLRSANPCGNRYTTYEQHVEAAQSPLTCKMCGSVVHDEPKSE